MIRASGERLLRHMGFDVLLAPDGATAIDLYRRHAGEIWLVMLDLIMPGLDGGRTFDRIRHIDPTLRVLLSSGYALDGQAEAVIKKGCNGFIQKPFTIQELSNKIRSVLSGSVLHP